MKLRKPSFAIITFFVGFAAFWLIGLMFYSKENFTDSSASLNDFRNIKPVEAVNAFPIKNEPRFKLIGNGDGFGWSEHYQTDDGQRLVNGCDGFNTPKKARVELEKKIKQAAHVVERIPNYARFDKINGERIVIINPPDENGKETAGIIFYSGDQFICSTDAPSVELALEFESFKTDFPL